ncbi:MAG: vitamin B12 dependent methionine synthase [Chloroflexota bacterium]
MTAVILDEIPFEPEFGPLARKLRLGADSARTGQLRRLLDEAQAIARPRALYRVAYVDSRTEDSVTLDGHTFKSRVLRVNLAEVHRVFAYVATCGEELYEWKTSLEDMLERYYADTINEAALRAARRALREHFIERYRLGRTATMNPGSLEDWPIYQQRPLFALLGNPEEAIGVRLSPSMLMIPPKSVSGIRFPTEKRFASCQLCPREGCPSRRAPYDEALYERGFAPHDSARDASPEG